MMLKTFAFLISAVFFFEFTSPSDAQFRSPDAQDYCENSETIRETWLIVDVSNNSIPEDWVKQVIPSLRSALHPRERLIVLATNSASKRTLPTFFDECYINNSREERQKLDAKKNILEKWITDSASELNNAEQNFDFKFASAIERLLLEVKISERSVSNFPMIFPLLEDVRLANINSDTKRFLRVVFVGFPFRFDPNNENLKKEFIASLSKYPIGSMEIHIVAQDRDNSLKEGKSLGEFNELIFRGLGVNVKNVNSALLLEPGKRIKTGYALSGYWEYKDTKSGDTAELSLFSDATGRVDYGKIIMQSISGYTSVPLRGTIVCKDQGCKFKGEVSNDVPALLSETNAEPIFFRGDPVNIEIKDNAITGKILAGGSKSRDTSAQNTYLINFEK